MNAYLYIRKSLIIILLLILLFSPWYLEVSGYHPTLSYSKSIKIQSDKQLRDFIGENHFPGNGTPENPYIITCEVDSMILENISANLILSHCRLGFGYFRYLNISNVSDLRIENSEVAGWMRFRNVHNITLISVSSEWYWVLRFQNSTRVRIVDSSGKIKMYFENSQNVYFENLSFTPESDYGINIENVKNLHIYSVSLYFLDIDDSENIHLSRINLTGWISSFGCYNCNGITMENSYLHATNGPYFYDSSNLTLKNLSIYGELDIYGWRHDVRNITLENTTGMIYSICVRDAQSVQIRNVSICNPSSGMEWVGIGLHKVIDANLDGVYINGPFLRGIYLNGTSRIKVRNAYISVDCVKVTYDEYGYPVKRHVSAGIYIRDSRDIVIENSFIDVFRHVGINMENVSYATLRGNQFAVDVTTPIKFDYATSHILLQNNTRSAITHPIDVEILLFLFLLALLITAGWYNKREEYSRKATEEYYRKIRKELEGH